jgi:protein CpxP
MEMPVMKVTMPQRAVPLLLATMLGAAPALAQTVGGPTPPASSPNQTSTAPSGTGQKGTPHTSRSASGRQPGETLQALTERRIADLHNRLHITPQQSQQWDQFTQVVRDNAREMEQIYQQRAERLGTMSAVDNIQSFAQIEQHRAQDTQKLVPAFQTLYVSLTDQQKKTADELFRNYAENARSRHRAAAQ